MTGFGKKTVEMVIKNYQKKDIKNDYREVCDKIIEMYEKSGIIEDWEVRLIFRQCEAEGNELAASVHNRISNPEGEIRITLSKIPKNCMECPLIITLDDDDAFDFGKTKVCPFGCNCYEWIDRRPIGCPIIHV